MEYDDRISQIDTLWSMVRRAHDDGATMANQAQEALLHRYGGAVHRYALAALRSEDAADEVFQEFALKFVKGDFGNANPERGKFRSFVKTAVYHLIVDYQRRKKRRRESPMQSNVAEPAAGEDGAKNDELFRCSWRDELLDRAWSALEEEERQTGKPYHTALRHRVEHPDLRSPELAEQLGAKLGKDMKAGAVRVLLHRARDKFADLLLTEVMDTLDDGSLTATEEELIELDLLEYCRPAIDRRREN